MTIASERVDRFFHDEHRLEYTEYGGGEKWVVLVHPYLLTRRSQQALARRLAASGLHVVALDLLGHGRSDRPADPTTYSVDYFASQVLGLLDHLGADSAVLGGTGLGANVALTAAVAEPRRVSGVIAESPLLDNALQAVLASAGLALFAARRAPMVVSGLRYAGRLVPQRLLPDRLAAAFDVLDQRPGALAATVHGTLYGRLAPAAGQRSRLDVPLLAVGHGLDPLRPNSDAALLAEEVAGARLVRGRGPLVRMPTRVAEEMSAFAHACFDEPARGRLTGN